MMIEHCGLLLRLFGIHLIIPSCSVMMSCCDANHIAAIDVLYYQTVDARITAQSKLVDKRTSNNRSYEHNIPHWKEVCAEQHQLSQDAFVL